MIPKTQRAILLFGYPGSGKGTQGKILSALPGFHHVAMGDILRALTPENPLITKHYPPRGGDFARTQGFAVTLEGADLKTTGIVRCDQPRTIDLRARGGRRLERVPKPVVDEVLAKLSTLFE